MTYELLGIIFAIYLILNAVTFIFYFVDKRLAIKHKYRIPEKTLLGLGLIVGAIGALLGMKIVRHKTKHWYFWVINIIGLILQIALFIFLFTTIK